MSGETSNQVSGVVRGPSVQARQIHGDVHIHQPTVPQRGQLPPPSLLVGREAELRAMDTARGSRLILISGPPGVRKTALAVSWAHSVRSDFADGVLLANLRGHSSDAPAAPYEALGRFVRALGLDTHHRTGDFAELTTSVRGRSFMIEPVVGELRRELAERGVDVNAPNMVLDRSPVLCAPAALFSTSGAAAWSVVAADSHRGPRGEAVTRAVCSTSEKER